MEQISGVYDRLKSLSKRIFPPKKELSDLEQAANILTANAEFRWCIPWEIKWGGLNKGQLLGMMGEISEFIGIDPEEAEKIKVFFGDNMYHFRNNQKHYSTAVCLNIDGSYKKYQVILNRSLEIAQGSGAASYKQLEKVREAQEQAQLPKTPECMFRNPWEVIAWFMAEELAHAQYGLQAGSVEKYKQKQEEHKRKLQTQGLQESTEYPYTFDPDELTASRKAVQALAALAKPRDPQRVNYFHELHEQSLRTGQHIIPYITKAVIEKTFINTK